MIISKFTLCFIEQDTKILLARKTKKVGIGLWNGYGGKIEPDEKSAKQSVIREVKEECGLDIYNIHRKAIIYFQRNDELRKVFIFSAETNQKPSNSDEMISPTWFDKNDLPFNEMMQADKIWLPYYIQNKKFNAKFFYDEGWNLVDYKINFKF